jgi:hypothetical protein
MTLALLSALCISAATVVLIAAHIAPTGYSPVSNAVSEYGVGRFHWLYRAMVLLLAAGAALLAIALRKYTTVGGSVVWLWIFAASRVLIAFFMTDRLGDEPTLTGRIHYLLASSAFVSIAIGAPSIGADLADFPGFDVAGDVAYVLGWVVAAMAIATFLFIRIGALRPWFGLVERLLYASYVAWLLVVAFKLATVAP